MLQKSCLVDAWYGTSGTVITIKIMITMENENYDYPSCGSSSWYDQERDPQGCQWYTRKPVNHRNQKNSLE